MNTWIDVSCPSCSRRNFVCLGSGDDFLDDIDGVECFRCKFKWILDPDLFPDITVESPDARIAKGKATAR